MAPITTVPEFSPVLNVLILTTALRAVLLPHPGGRKPGYRTIKFWIKASEHLNSTDSSNI